MNDDRQICEPLYGLWLQAVVRDAGEQGFVDRFPERIVSWRAGNHGCDIPECGAVGSCGMGPESGVRRVLREREGGTFHCGDAEGKAEVFQGPERVLLVYCENVKGERFIVEMQKARQKYFKDRSVFYSTFPIREQAKVGDWDYELKSVYTVGILNFVFDEDKDDEEYYHHEVKLMDVGRKEVFYEKLTFIYLEMPKFRKREEELETLFDKWMFVLKNLATLLDRPAALQERVFKRLFETAEIARFSESEIRDYEESLKNLRDLGNVLNTAKEEGRKEGRKEGIETMALRMRDDGMPLEVIAKYTGLSVEEIQNLKS